MVGVVVVPVLYYIFTLAEIDESIRMHLSIGTSLANIVPISIISAFNHAKRKSVDLSFLRFIFISVVLGVVLGSVVVSFLEGSSLILIYSILLMIVSCLLFLYQPLLLAFSLYL